MPSPLLSWGLGLAQVPEVGVDVDIPSVEAVDAGREVVEDEQFLSVYFSVGRDIDVRHIDPFLFGETVSDWAWFHIASLAILALAGLKRNVFLDEGQQTASDFASWTIYSDATVAVDLEGLVLGSGFGLLDDCNVYV